MERKIGGKSERRLPIIHLKRLIKNLMLPWHLAKRILRVLECFSNEMRERINEKMQIFKAKLTLILRIVQSEKKNKR